MATPNGKSVIVQKPNSALQTWEGKRISSTPCIENGFWKIAWLLTVRPDIVFNADSSRLGVVGRKSLPATGGGHGILKKKMKNIVLVLFTIICGASKINGQTTSDAEQIAVSMYLPVKSFLELNEADYNLFIQTLKKTDITEEQKYDILKVNPSILNYLTSCSTAVKSLDLLNAQRVYSNPENRNEIMKYFDVQLGFEPKQLDCGVYEAQADNCNAQYLGCGILGYATCIGSGPLYFICASAVFAGCTTILSGCHGANNANYSNCAKLAGRGEFWKNIQNPWLIPVTLPYPPSADQD